MVTWKDLCKTLRLLTTKKKPYRLPVDDPPLTAGDVIFARNPILDLFDAEKEKPRPF